MTAIEVEDVSFSYRTQRDDRALEDVSLSVEEGEFVGVVGETGAGKTTLLSAMCGVIPFNTPGSLTGAVRIKDRSIADYGSIYDLAADVSMVLDSPENQLFNLHIFEEVIWGPENMGMDREEILERGREAIELFDLAGLEDRITYTLSGGEKQKVAIASIYAMNPDIILLDEPTSQLDPIGTEMVFEAISKLAAEGKTIVMVEHKIEELVRYADRIGHLEDGRLTRVADTRSFFLDVATHDVAPPQVTELGTRLAARGVDVEVPLELTEATATYGRLLDGGV